MKKLTDIQMKQLFLNKVTCKDSIEGQESIAMESDGRLVLGTVCHCDLCPNVGFVNMSGIHSSTNFNALLKHPFIYSNRFVGEDVFADNDTGGTICAECEQKKSA